MIDLNWGRFYAGEPIIGPLSRCANCRAPSRLVELLPFAGRFTWEDGVCPNCGEPITLRSAYLPIGASLLFLISYSAFDGELGAALLGGFFATIFFTLALTDLETRLLPNRIVYTGTVIAILTCWGWPDTSVVEILAGGAVGIAIAAGMLLLSLPFGGGAFGLGDVKMIIFMGFVLGVPSILTAVVLGTLIAGAVAAVLLITRVKGRRDYIPHGPFLAIGAILCLFWGQELWLY